MTYWDDCVTRVGSTINCLNQGISFFEGVFLWQLFDKVWQQKSLLLGPLSLKRFGVICADKEHDSLEEINPTLQEETPMRFWLILTFQMVYFEKQLSTREVPLGKTR